MNILNFPCYFDILLQVSTPDTSSTATVLAWVCGIMAVAVGAVATFYVKSQADHRKALYELNKTSNERVDKLNEEVRLVYENSATRIMEWKQTLENSSRQMQESGPELKELIKELTQKMDEYQKEVMRIANGTAR